MALPTHEDLMIPLLRILPGGAIHSYADHVPLPQRDFRRSEAGLLSGLRRFAIGIDKAVRLDSQRTRENHR